MGGVIGVGLGMLGGRLHPRLPGGGLTARYEGIYAIGFALFAFGLAEVTWGNGLIAAFVCGIAMAASERQVPEGFVEFAESTSAILQVMTFFVFGALIVATGFHHSIPPLILFVVFALLVARPVAVMLSFLRTGIPRSEKLFMAWFGPKGVASMLFALFVLKSQVDDSGLIFDVASIAIIASIVAHGLTDTVGAKWMARRTGLSEASSETNVTFGPLALHRWKRFVRLRLGCMADRLDERSTRSADGSTRTDGSRFDRVESRFDRSSSMIIPGGISPLRSSAVSSSRVSNRSRTAAAATPR